jgi:hypothetical protein
MAPDVTINLLSDEGSRILDVYANGGLVKDRISAQTWRVASPHEFQAAIVRSLA